MTLLMPDFPFSSGARSDPLGCFILSVADLRLGIFHSGNQGLLQLPTGSRWQRFGHGGPTVGHQSGEPTARGPENAPTIRRSH